MSTSEPNSGAPVPKLRAERPPLDLAGMASEVARLANEFFLGAPAPASAAAAALGTSGASVTHRLGPSALAVGGGGLSPASSQPPVPGFLHSPPLAASPISKEADVRPAPTLLAELLGGPTPLELMLSADSRAPSDTPYFLQHAGLPVAAPPGSPVGALPGLPAAAPLAPPTGGSALNPERESARPALSAEAAPSIGYSPELVPDLGASPGIFDAHAIKKDFPILDERVHNGKRLVWLDNAATTQKPRAVIDRLSYFYEHENSNIHRAAHTLAARATDAYEGARERVRRFLNAPSAQEIVFTRGATEAINLVAQSWGRRNVGPGDEIVISWLEHHANIVPWQLLAAEKGARLRVAPVDDRGQVILEEYEKLLGPRTRLVSVSQVSNALGTIVPVREMIEMAHRHGARILIDGAQAVSHLPVDVQALDCDFYCFSGHKIFAPTGIGALYGKSDVLAAMPPWQGGGNMIADVTFEKTTYQPPPGRFEAGTGSIADAVGLGAALDYLSAIGLENVSRYEHDLLGYATEQLLRVPGLRLIGTAAEKAGVLSFVLDGQRTEDVGGALDQEGIAVRSGHHCAQPILRRLGLESTVRASLAPYNTREDIDALVAALKRLQGGRPPR